MEQSVKQRLILFLKYIEIGQAAFAEQIGVSKGYVNNISKGIGADVLHRISAEYPELNTEWLIMGKGEMLKTTNIKIDNSNKGKKIDASYGGCVHIGNKNIDELSKKEMFDAIQERFSFLIEKEKEIKEKEAMIQRKNEIIDKLLEKEVGMLKEISEQRKLIDKLIDKNASLMDKLTNWNGQNR